LPVAQGAGVVNESRALTMAGIAFEQELRKVKLLGWGLNVFGAVV
jgi:hypothetical protein